jgi:hypothetical protein
MRAACSLTSSPPLRVRGLCRLRHRPDEHLRPSSAVQGEPGDATDLRGDPCDQRPGRRRVHFRSRLHPRTSGFVSPRPHRAGVKSLRISTLLDAPCGDIVRQRLPSANLVLCREAWFISALPMRSERWPTYVAPRHGTCSPRRTSETAPTRISLPASGVHSTCSVPPSSFHRRSSSSTSGATATAVGARTSGLVSGGFRTCRRWVAPDPMSCGR